MKIICSVFLMVFVCFAFAKAESKEADSKKAYDKECIYVDAINGLNMRNAPNSKAEIIEKLPYGTKLDWTPPGTNDVKSYVMDDDKKVLGYWVKVWRSVPYQELKGNPSGYVFSAYLSYHLKVIPSQSLLLFDEIVYNDYANDRSLKARYLVDEDTYNYSAYIDCYPRYQEHYGELIEENVADARQFLASKIALELVDFDEVSQLRKLTGYELDTSYKPKKIYQSQDDHLYDFKLPLQNGDSLTITANRGEFAHNSFYLGEIKKKNLYVVGADFEGIEYSMFSTIDGKLIAHDSPNYSPNGTYNVSHDEVYYELGAQIYISYYGKAQQEEQTLFINFQSWSVDSSLESSFWISDNELILRAHPVDNTIQVVDMDDPVTPNWQYLKLTIKQ